MNNPQLSRSVSSAFIRGLALLLVLGFPALASACNVPVFRYALEKWRPDAYEVVIFQSGESTAEDEARIAAVKAESVAQGGLANFAVTVVDTNEIVHDAIRRIWEEQSTVAKAAEDLPWVVVQSPVRKRTNVTLWGGKLADFEAAKLLDSPARRELAKRLLAGQSAVWIVLPGSDAAANEQAKTVLAKRLTELEGEIKLPEGIGEPGSEVESPLPVAIRFSVLEIHRDDPAEKVFLQHLLHATPDLAAADEPLVIPVYGCGRALDVLAGEELEPEILERAAKFLCGACSCQVKEQNPGFDLLLKTDWDSIFAAGAPRLARETKHDAPAEAEYVPIAPGPSLDNREKGSASPYHHEVFIHDSYIQVTPSWGLVAILGFVGLLMIGAVLFGVVIALRATPRGGRGD